MKDSRRGHDYWRKTKRQMAFQWRDDYCDVPHRKPMRTMRLSARGRGEGEHSLLPRIRANSRSESSGSREAHRVSQQQFCSSKTHTRRLPRELHPQHLYIDPILAPICSLVRSRLCAFRNTERDRRDHCRSVDLECSSMTRSTDRYPSPMKDAFNNLAPAGFSQSLSEKERARERAREREREREREEEGRRERDRERGGGI